MCPEVHKSCLRTAVLAVTVIASILLLSPAPRTVAGHGYNSAIYNVTSSWPNSAGSIILYERHNGTGILSPSSYADIAVYTAFEQDRRPNHTESLQTVQILNSMWDGNGLVDDA